MGNFLLPSRFNLYPHITRELAMNEFKMLDIYREGQLSFLVIKSALEMNNIFLEDYIIKQWIVENDGYQKGYVDEVDYLGIYGIEI